jgi:nicotinate dehydrogenase subunit B
VRLDINGTQHEIAGDPSRALLFVLRDELSLTGTKPACAEGVCGACTVLVDGLPVRSCVTPVGDVGGRKVTTIEGLSTGGSLHPAQRALLEERAFQCGYCTPGMALAVAALVDRDPDPDDAEVFDALDGNICRCGTYVRILRSIDRLRSGEALSPEGADAGAPNALRPRATLEVRNGPWDMRTVGERDYFDVLGDGLVVVVPPPAESSGWEAAWTTSGGAWVHVGADGLATAFTGKVEMGQNNGVALAAIVASAAGVDASAVRIVMADTDVCPYDEGTFGSRSMPDAGAMLRAAGWMAASLLVALAAERLEANPRDLVVRDGGVESRDAARRLPFGDLLAGIRRVETVAGRVAPPRALSGWAVDLSRLTIDIGRAIVTGHRQFTTDLGPPGTLVGCELVPPVAGAVLESVDVSAAEAQPGVMVVHEHDLVAVAGPDAQAAERAIAAVRAEWQLASSVSSAELEDHLRSHPVDDTGWDGVFEYESGDIDAAPQRGVTLRETYTTAYVAHFPLESRAALASWSDDRVTVWTTTQAPFEARQEVAEALGVGEDRVRVIVPPLGAGFGGKHGAGPGIAAARLSRAAGRPVRVRWRHSDEFALGHVRPAAIIDIAATVAPDWSIQGWDFSNLNAGPSAIRSPYHIAAERLRHQPADSPLPQSSYRALAATANTFARESMIDELAAVLGADPLQFRLANVNDKRLAEVLKSAAERAGWTTGRSGEHEPALGIAGSIEKDARVATCAEVRVAPDGHLRVVRIVTAFDCGAIVDADNLTNQIEGATVMAIGPALFEAVGFDRSRVTTASLSTYRVPKFSDVPEIDVVLVDRPDVPSAGGGEVPLIAVGPAIANAIHAASGIRLRSMPLVPGGELPIGARRSP